METLNALQCREARMILRWNARDLAHKSNVPMRRINRFEEMKELLYAQEMAQIIGAFEKEGVLFSASGEATDARGAATQKKVTSRKAESEDAGAAVLAKLLGRTAQD